MVLHESLLFVHTVSPEIGMVAFKSSLDLRIAAPKTVPSLKRGPPRCHKLHARAAYALMHT